MPRNKAKKWPSAILNNATFIDWYNRLSEIAINRFEWVNLPDSVDERFLEVTLFENGYALFFQDDVLDAYLALPANLTGNWNVYGVPNDRVAVGSNDYQYFCTPQNSVIIWANALHNSLIEQTRLAALRLYECDRTIDVNVKAQKTPVMITATEPQRLVMKNLYEKYDGNEPFIFANKGYDITQIGCINTQAPFIADRILQLKHQYYNEYLTSLGIENSNEDKRERLVANEVGSNYGAVESNRFVALNARKQACKLINRLFGLNVDVRYRSMLNTMVNNPSLPGTESLEDAPPVEQQQEEDNRKLEVEE